MKRKFNFGLILFVFSASLAFADGFKPTSKPVVLPSGTDGSYGTKGTYVLFGDWPQTVKADDITVSSEPENINGFECYKGSDGYYYVKAEAEPYDYFYEFSTGNYIDFNEVYYFKIEPIKWRVVTNNYQGGKLLVAENILAAKYYDSDSNNNYKNSEIRAWLLEDFLNSAFTKEAIDSINTVTVDNSVKSTGDSENGFVCENTKDKIFLLSVKELLTSSYGFKTVTWDEDTARCRKTTDYSRATGSYASSNGGYKFNGWWWLRTPYNRNAYYGKGITSGGDIMDYYLDENRRGVVPALSISF